jgi:hypothetical protein
MPCILKQQTPNSPGVITFTHGEALWGLPKRSKRVRDALLEAKKSGRWIFGIHVQGDCSHLSEWPMPEWQSFVMWPKQDAPFLRNLPAAEFCPYTCINFMPAFLAEKQVGEKEWDLCVISRASSIKRIEETLQLIRILFDKRPDTRVVMIVPDPRHQELGSKAYKQQRIDESYFKLPLKLFSARELKNISFISSSQDSFGNFPLADGLVADILAKSKFMMLTSHLEGVPRVIAEALLVGTPCIVSENLRSGLNEWLSDGNSIRIADEPSKGVSQILEALSRYDRFFPDRWKMKRAFSESEHLQSFQGYLAEHIGAAGFKVEGKWYLEDLHLRLACHGKKHHLQFFNREKLFFDWLERANALTSDYADEDFLAGTGDITDTPTFRQALRRYAATSVHRLRMVLS